MNYSNNCPNIIPPHDALDGGSMFYHFWMYGDLVRVLVFNHVLVDLPEVDLFVPRTNRYKMYIRVPGFGSGHVPCSTVLERDSMAQVTTQFGG